MSLEQIRVHLQEHLENSPTTENNIIKLNNVEEWENMESLHAATAMLLIRFLSFR